MQVVWAHTQQQVPTQSGKCDTISQIAGAPATKWAQLSDTDVSQWATEVDKIHCPNLVRLKQGKIQGINTSF